MNDNSLVASQPLNGLQMGEYFGFSLLAIDLNGDEYAHSYILTCIAIMILFYMYARYSYDELLVGAPLFRISSTEPEIGRIFLYRNNRVRNSLSESVFPLSLSEITAALSLSLLSLQDTCTYWYYAYTCTHTTG